MNRKTIAFASTLAFAATAALAQSASSPDFSPLQPRILDQQSSSSSYDSAATTDRAVAPPDNTMLQGYESSNLRPGEPAAAPLAQETYAPQSTRESAPQPSGQYAPGSTIRERTVRVAPAAPYESTIGNGLFNRRGPNDFGA